MSISKMQREYLDNASRRWNIKTGAVRSGKTYIDTLCVIPKRIRSRLGKPGLTVILGVTKETIERNVLEPMRNLYGKELVGEIDNRNRCYLFGERVYCLGAEKVSQVSKLRGASVKYCYGDEVADWNEEVFDLLKSRLDKPYSCFDGALNPQGPNHWLKEFLDSEEFDIYCQKYTIFDNPFLDPAFVENLCKEYEGSVYYQRYILGEWALAEGLVYPMFSREKHVFSGEIERKPNSRYYVSLDYGTVNPFAGGIYEIAGRKVRKIREIHHDGRKSGRLDNEEYYKIMCDAIGDLPIEYVVVDPSAAGFIETIKKHSRYIVKAANNDVLNGIQEVTKYLNYGLYQVHDSCVETIKEYQQYAWDDKSVEDAVIKESDHHADADRYLIYTVARQLNKWVI